VLFGLIALGTVVGLFDREISKEGIIELITLAVIIYFFDPA